jgi:hypothetical protein
MNLLTLRNPITAQVAALSAVLLLLFSCDSSKQAAGPPARLGSDITKAIMEKVPSLANPVSVHLYRGGEGEVQGEEAQLLVELLEKTSSAISAKPAELSDGVKEILGVSHGPVFEMSSPVGGTMRYYGFPERKEVGPFVDSVVLASGGPVRLSEKMTDYLTQLEQEMVIRIFTTPD